MANQVLNDKRSAPMQDDLAPKQPVELGDLERENRNAFSNLRSIIAALRGLNKVEQELLAGNDDPPSAANAAKAGKS